ncbi:neuronal acetylcholine receptor subunit alpha-10-like [Lingula anatina]|uniref:Neuronal acetylcholine receptor subunit alpha-10-like n=1 Tax=Lingula anatina TaxID=7574 RepID=A0A1S3JDZ8_LINAN|nr:neuronal acetylcholine receptor subunit alpha-10-like [Lingula anatina]|eukprot:XP_013408627.1 neuronal acetylcholine receptor subunit alpha-10-like [Lingula anatina]
MAFLSQHFSGLFICCECRPFIRMMWIDPKLVWDPNKYGGIRVIRVPYDQVWLPDILLYNNADVQAFMSSVSTNVIINHVGNITWLSTVIYKSSCTINVANFPFDEQNCSMLFSSWSYDGYQLNLVMVSDEGDVSNYMQSTEWVLVKLFVERNVQYYSCCAEPYPDITYYVHIRRRPMFYVFNMMLPCVLITLVALLGFYVPSDSGEKVTMGITTLLSMTVFLMLVTESMPPSSENLPLIGIYYGVTIAIVSGATAMTVLTLNIHHKGVRGKEPPRWVKKVCFKYLAKILFMRLDLPENMGLDSPLADVIDGPKSTYIRLKSSNSFGRRRKNKSSNRYEGASTSTTVLNGESKKTQTKLRRDSHTRRNILPCCLGDGEKDDQHDPYGRDGVGSRLNAELKADDPHQENGGISPRFARRIRNLGNMASEASSSDNFEKQFSRVLQKVYQTIERNEMRLAEQDRRDAIKLEWQQVAQVVDRLLLYIFVLTTVMVTMVTIITAQVRSKHMASTL